MQMQLPDMIEADLARVEEMIRLRSISDEVERINQVTAHLFENGGKRLRPILTVSTANLLGYKGQDHIRLAAAVEFVHTATLVHDDVVDQSMQRRGRPSANFLWENKSSVLVGDYLFARSFQLMVATQSVEALAILADASATISEAEVHQLVTQHDLDIGDETYLKIIRGKTAVLFAAAAKIGAVIAGGTDAQISACERYGDALGIGFQIMDDLLDYTGSSLRLGKNVGDDFRDRKVTLPVIRACQTASQQESNFWNRVFVKGQQASGDLEHALALLSKRGIFEKVAQEARDWATHAKKELGNMQSLPIGKFLCKLADLSVARST